MIGTPVEWRDIPGYNGAYQVSWEGEVRSFRYRGTLLEKPRLLHPYTHNIRGGKKTRKMFVKLVSPNGKAHDVAITKIVCNTWLGGVPKGKVPYHKNGQPEDNCVRNIGFITRKELGKLSGAKGNRIPVAKIGPGGEVLEIYQSARQAAKENYMSLCAILNRCHNRVKDPLSLDGCTYQFDY